MFLLIDNEHRLPLASALVRKAPEMPGSFAMWFPPPSAMARFHPL